MEPTLEAEIRLTLIDDLTSEVMSRSQVAPAALPDSFRAETTLNIAGENWWVVEAEPTTRQEFVESGSLELRLRRIENVPSQDVRFSLPTLCDALPPTEGPLLEGTELLLHEDDWRQVEWVSATLEVEVQGELAAIRPLLAEGAADNEGQGFPDLYPRRGLSQPLVDSPLQVADLQRIFPQARRSRVAFETSSQTISQSFSLFVAPASALYGLVGKDSRIEVLALADLSHGMPRESSEELLSEDLYVALRDLTTAQGLLLVDWCQARLARPEDTSFRTLLQGHKTRSE